MPEPLQTKFSIIIYWSEVCVLRQVKFPKIFNIAPQNLWMVELVLGNTKKIDVEVINQIQFGLLTFFGGSTAVQVKKFDQP